MEDTFIVPSNQRTGGNRGHAAPFRPSAAVAGTHPYAGLSGYLHGCFDGFRSNGEHLRGHVPYTADPFMSSTQYFVSNTHGANQYATAGYVYDAISDAFAYRGEPGGGSAGYVYDAIRDGFAYRGELGGGSAGYVYDASAYRGEPGGGYTVYNAISDAIRDGFAYRGELGGGSAGYVYDASAYRGEPGGGYTGYVYDAISDAFAYREEPGGGYTVYNAISDAYRGEPGGCYTVYNAISDAFAYRGEPGGGYTGYVYDAISDAFAYREEPGGGYTVYNAISDAYRGEPGGGYTVYNAISDAFAYHGELGGGYTGVGFSLLRDPRRGTDGHAHDAISDGFAFHGEPRRGAAGNAQDAFVDGFVFRGEPSRGAAGHAHDAIVDGFAFRGEPSLGATGHAHDANGAASCTVQSVWRDNCADVFEDVVAKLLQPRCHLYVALDLEFVADASIDVHYRPFTWKEWYDHLHAFVNGGDVVQVGLAFAFEPERRHGGSRAPLPVIALEINLEFDEDARQYNGASLDFLAKQGHCLAEHRERGVTAEQFLDGLLRHLVSGHDDPITWITYHGDHDLGFLMRLLQERQGRGRGALPSDRAIFMRQVRQQFPIFYDVRVLGQLVREGFSGKLSVLAELLGVRRIGDKHHAGSDALLAMSCFSEILRRSQHELHRLDSRRCLLSGMEEHDMAIKCARHIDDVNVKTVDVREANFDEQARWIEELVTSNFKIVGVDVSLPPSGWESPLCSAADQKDYDLMKSSLEGIGEFQVVIGFMNAEGMLALGRVWKFYLRCSNIRIDLAGKNDCVDPRRLARLLESCRATHNPDVVWAMCQGLEGIACLIMSSMAAGGGLPDDWCSYVEHRRGRFPRMYDVGLIAAQRWPDIGGLYDIARKLEVIKDEDKQPMEKVLVVLRCYERLGQSSQFPLIASAA